MRRGRQVGATELKPGLRLWAATGMGAIYSVAYWCGATLDSPHGVWWKHGIAALCIGLLLGLYYYVVLGRPTPNTDRPTGVRRPTSPWLVWSLVGLFVVFIVSLAIYRKGLAEYVAGAILVSGAVVIGLLETRPMRGTTSNAAAAAPVPAVGAELHGNVD